jgi:hypothetical protein
MPTARRWDGYVRRYPRGRPPSSQMPTACPWDCYARRYVSEAIVHPSPPGSGGAAAARRKEKEGEAAGCSSKREAPTGKPWASRTCQCPRLDRGIITLAAIPAVARLAPECSRLARGMVTFAATSARQLYPHLRGAAAAPPLPGGEKRKGRRPVVAANVRLPRASRGHPGPAHAHGLPVAWFHSPLPGRAA